MVTLGLSESLSPLDSKYTTWPLSVSSYMLSRGVVLRDNNKANKSSLLLLLLSLSLFSVCICGSISVKASNDMSIMESTWVTQVVLISCRESRMNWSWLSSLSPLSKLCKGTISCFFSQGVFLRPKYWLSRIKDILCHGTQREGVEGQKMWIECNYLQQNELFNSTELLGRRSDTVMDLKSKGGNRELRRLQR